MLKARWLGGALVAALCLGVTGNAHADILWNWSFVANITSRIIVQKGPVGSAVSESGTFLTDGDLVANAAAPGTYTVLGFAVLNSGIDAPIGSTTDSTYSPVGTNLQFDWDGSIPTNFSSSGGDSISFSTSVNGGALYEFISLDFPVGLVSFSGLYAGDLSLAPVTNVTAPEPVSMTGMLLGLPLLGMIRRRAIRS